MSLPYLFFDQSGKNCISLHIGLVNSFTFWLLEAPRCLSQPVKHPILDFSSGHDLMVREFDPWVWLCAESVEPAPK